MNKLIVSIICLILPFSINAQFTEFSLHASSGLFKFQNKPGSQTSTAVIARQGNNVPELTQNPYGEESGNSFSFAFQVQHYTEKNIILGTQLAYEQLQSKNIIDRADGTLAQMITVNSGESILTNEFINVFPFVGKRINTKTEGLDFDIFLGCDFGFFLSSKENVKITTSNNDLYEFQTLRNEPVFDGRVRFGANVYYKFIGINLGYSYGFVNYNAPSFRENTVPVSESRMLRIGLVYRINRQEI
jgi:hypothetical protein